MGINVSLSYPHLNIAFDGELHILILVIVCITSTQGKGKTIKIK